MKYLAVTALALLGCAATAAAHHSYAMFDVGKKLSLTGVVKEWQWTNPHTWLVLVAPDGQKTDVEWGIEGSSPAIWRRYGATRDMVKVSDRITVVIHPLRSGAKGGQVESITTADGTTYDLAKAAQ